jgi:hypothetical protein
MNRPPGRSTLHAVSHTNTDAINAQLNHRTSNVQQKGELLMKPARKLAPPELWKLQCSHGADRSESAPRDLRAHLVGLGVEMVIDLPLVTLLALAGKQSARETT